MYQGIREMESTMAAEWTDEKHSMYIKSIEASFVNQLYDSKQMKASFSCKGTSCDPATTSGQVSFLICSPLSKNLTSFNMNKNWEMDLVVIMNVITKTL